MSMSHDEMKILISPETLEESKMEREKTANLIKETLNKAEEAKKTGVETMDAFAEGQKRLAELIKIKEAKQKAAASSPLQRNAVMGAGADSRRSSISSSSSSEGNPSGRKSPSSP